MMIASEAEASITSDSLMPPVCEWMMLIATRSCGTFASSSWSASREPATSALRTMLSSLISPSWARAKTSSRLTLRPWRRASASVLSRWARSPAIWRAWRSLSTVCTNSPASATPSKPSTSTGIPGPASSTPLAGEVLHRPDPAPLGPGDERVADAERAALDQDGDDRAAAGVELGLDHVPGGGRVRVGRELLELGDEQDHVEQVVEALVGLRRDLAEDGVPAPLLGGDLHLGELAADLFGVGALFVDLVDGDQHRHVGGAGVVDRLLGLRHDAVVGGDDHDDDVGDLGAAGAHRREGGVARACRGR